MRKIGLGLLVGMGFLASGCANMGVLHTARIVPEKKTRIVVGGGAMIIPVGSAAATALGGSSLTLPMGEASARHAFGKRFEVGLKYSVLSTGDIDLKFNFFDTRWLTMSMGAGFGYVDLSLGSATTEAGIIRMYPVLYLDFNFTNWLALYMNGKYHFNFLTSSAGGVVAAGIYHQAGGGGGLKIGPDIFGVLAEFNVFYTFTSVAGVTPWIAYQPMAGMYFTF
mgnify:FL=1